MGLRAGSPALLRLKLGLAPAAWRLLTSTVRVEPRPVPLDRRDGPVVFACLHRDFIPAMLYVRPLQPVLLVSQSPDGDVLMRTLARDGFGFARGSTGKGGGPAVARMLAALREGRCVGVAVDGPRGPFGEVKEGVVLLSRLSGRPVIPLRVAPGSHWRLRTWDRTVVPRPGSRISVLEGSPVLVPSVAEGGDDAEWGARIAAALGGEAP